MFEYGNELQKIKNPSLITELGLLSDDCGGKELDAHDRERSRAGVSAQRSFGATQGANAGVG